MFRKVRDAAQAGRKKVARLLNKVGIGIKRTALYGALGGLTLAKGILFVVHKTFRTVTWTWMSVVEVVSMTMSPFTWFFGNILFALFRGAENLVNWIRTTENTRMHDRYPMFTLLNAVAMTNEWWYLFVALVGWLLSPLTGVEWWRNTAHGYKVRTVSAADFSFTDRIRRDIGYYRTFGEDRSVWEAASAPPKPDIVDTTIMTAAEYYEHNLAQGYVLVYPNTDVDEEQAFDYLKNRIMEVEDETWLTEFEMTHEEDQWGRHWASIPSGVSTQKPAKIQDVELPEPAEEAPEEVEVVQTETTIKAKHGSLVEFDITSPPDDYREIADPKERSFWYGATFLRESVSQITGFLNNTEQQARARALIVKDTRNPQTGFLMPYALKGFEAALEHDQEVASKV